VSRVLLVGVGGLGAPAAMALAAAGVGVLGLADDDVVELANLHRQILYGEGDVGRSKVLAARDAILRRAPRVHVEAHETRVLPGTAASLVAAYDVVVEGSDNFATKFLVADACALARRPVVHAAAVRWHGTTLAVSAGGRPCYRCVFEDLPAGDAPDCSGAGVMGPLVGLIAAAQVDLALAMLAGRDVGGTLVTVDGRTDAIRRRAVAARRGCPLCGEARRIDRLDPVRYVSGG